MKDKIEISTHLQFVELRKGLYWSAVAGAMRRYDIQATTHGNCIYCLYDAQSADVLWSGKKKTLLQAKRACMEHFASMPMDDVGDVGLFCQIINRTQSRLKSRKP